MLVEYYFEIKYVKGMDNVRADILSRKAELQSSTKLLDVMLCIDKDGKIRYNHPKLIAVYEVLVSNQMQRIQKAKEQDLDSKEYKNRELIYIPNKLAKEFIKDFYQEII